MRRVALLCAFVIACGGQREKAAAPPAKTAAPAPKPAKSAAAPAKSAAATPATQRVVLDPAQPLPDLWWEKGDQFCPPGATFQVAACAVRSGATPIYQGPYVLLEHGVPREEGWLDGGLQTGLRRTWRTGNGGQGRYLAAEEQFRAGQRDGLSRDYHPEGDRKLERNYRDGVLHGPVIRYRPSGEEIGRFDMVVGSGRWMEWSDGGALQVSGRLRSGAREGEWKEWADGKLARVTVYRGGVPQESRVTAGALELRVLYHPDGLVREIAEFAGDRPHGAATTYGPDGALTAQGSYARGKKQGEWFLFAAGGKGLAAIETYKNGKRIRRSTRGWLPAPLRHHQRLLLLGEPACDQLLWHYQSCQLLSSRSESDFRAEVDLLLGDRIQSSAASMIADWQARTSASCTETLWRDNAFGHVWAERLRAAGCPLPLDR